MQNVTNDLCDTSQVITKAQSHNHVYEAIERSEVFRKILAQAMGSDYPTDSTQYSFVGMQGLRWIAEKISKASSGTCIDIGCGDGSLSTWLQLLCNRKITGCDTSEKAIKIAKCKSQNNNDYLVADFCRLPIADGTVAAISALDCVQHAESPLLLVKELTRVSIPGTRFVFTHWMGLFDPIKLVRYDPLCSALSTAGFKIEEVINLDLNLDTQFRVYAYAHANRVLLEKELGSTLLHSLMSEAHHLHPLRSKVGHLAVSAIWCPECVIS